MKDRGVNLGMETQLTLSSGHLTTLGYNLFQGRQESIEPCYHWAQSIIISCVNCHDGKRLFYDVDSS